MAPKQKQAKRSEKTPVKSSNGVKVQDTPRSPSSVKVVGRDDAVRPAPAAPDNFERPKISKGPMYFFAASFLYRSLISPYWSTLQTTGLLNRPSYPSSYTAPGVSCAVEALDGPKFCEHEIIFADQGVALLSCDPGRGEWNTVMGPLKDPAPKGQLWLYDYADTKTSRALDLSGFPVDSDFHPLGINYFQDALATTLFVINHQRTGPSIELFSLNLGPGGLDSTLTWKRTVPAHEDLRSANGVVALNHDELYVTNDHAWTRLESGTGWALTETFSGPIYGQGWIAHVDLTEPTGPRISRARSGIPFANGIARGSDGKVYVASSIAGTVHVLAPRNSTTTALMELDVVQFGYSIDNVHVERGQGEGAGDVLLVGGHPSFVALTKLSRDPHGSLASPSWLSVATHRPVAAEGEKEKEKPVARKGEGWHEPAFNQEWDTRTIYQDDGSQFSSATGASIDRGRDVLISPGLYESGVLVCRGVNSLH